MDFFFIFAIFPLPTTMEETQHEIAGMEDDHPLAREDTQEDSDDNQPLVAQDDSDDDKPLVALDLPLVVQNDSDDSDDDKPLVALDQMMDEQKEPGDDEEEEDGDEEDQDESEDDQDDWVALADYPDYEIHRTTERIRSKETKQLLAIYCGKVMFMHQGKRICRSVAKLWRQTFDGETMEQLGGEWRAHPLYPDYLFSSRGRCWRISGDGMMVKGSRNAGYIILHITQGTSLRMHDLLAVTFLGPRPTPEHTANHIDKNGYNNDISNLEWASKSDQVRHSYAIGDRKSLKVRVGQYTLDGETLLNEFESFGEADTFLGKSKSYLSQRLNKYDGIIGEFLWKRIDAEEPCIDLEGEAWKPLFVEHRRTEERVLVPENFVSNLGRVRKNDMLRTQSLLPHGYKTLQLRLPGEKVSFNYHVHRLVAYNHVANPDDKPVVDHINGNKQDNNAINLRWATQKENAQFALNKPVEQLDLVTDAVLQRFASFTDAAASVGGLGSSIGLCVRGLQLTHKGFGWRLAVADDGAEDNIALGDAVI